MPESLNRSSINQIRIELQDLVLRDMLSPTGGDEEIIDKAYVRDRSDRAGLQTERGG